MIIDRIENKSIYLTRHSDLYVGMEFILDRFNESMPDGRYEIKGDDVYAIVQSHYTDFPENKKLESHRKYIDIQYIVSGKELMGWVPANNLEVMTPYSEEKDVIFYHKDRNISSFILFPGFFAIFYPDDAHMPGCVVDKPEFVRKIVVKVRVH